MKWPIMETKHLEQVKLFFSWLQNIGILDANQDIIEKVQDVVTSALSKNPTL